MSLTRRSFCRSSNMSGVHGMLKINGIAKSSVRIVPYQFDPTPLIKGEIDALADFVSDVPDTIGLSGKQAYSFLLDILTNKADQPLVDMPNGIIAMAEAGIAADIGYLKSVGIAADRSLFDTSLLGELAS